MELHKNARTTPFSRMLMVKRMEGGIGATSASEAAGVSRRTAFKWKARYREAGEAARRALKLNPGEMRMRYILALSLIKEGGSQDEALDNLQRAASTIPQAHLLAAKVLADTGRRNDAARHLDDYLRSAPRNESNRQQLEAWLAELKTVN